MKWFGIAAATLLAVPVHAQLPRHPTVTLETANRLASGALEACRRQGRDVAVAVLDAGGTLVALQRADGVGPHNVEAARRKAFTALSTRSATLGLARKAQADPDARNLATLPELLLLGGGIPLLAHAQPAGAIGVAGGGAQADHTCAVAAASTVPGIDPVSN